MPIGIDPVLSHTSSIEIKGTPHMNIFKTLALTTMAAVATAGPAMARSNHQAHVALSQAVQSVGISVYVNDPFCDTGNFYGVYSAGAKAILICQENRVKGSTQTVAWTEEDYDTLRHEAHHLVQDCRDGSLNSELASVYKRPIELGYEWLGREGTNRVAEMYDRQGASGHIQVMEIEAFAVARMNDPAEQIRDIRNFCF